MRPLALVLVLVIAYCMSAIGEIVLARVSRTLGEWNMSLLVGLSITSTAFFPLSLLARSQALNVTAGVLIAAGVAGIVRRIMTTPTTPRETGDSNHSFLVEGIPAKVILGLIILSVIQFGVYNYRLTYLWDGYQIWATKALVIYTRGQLTQDLLTPHTPDFLTIPNCCDGAERVAGYPQTVSLFEALVAKSEGQFVWEAIKAVFPLFFISMLISTFQAARAFVPPASAAAASLLLALIPVVAAGQDTGGYADMPQACLLVGFLAALFQTSGSRSPSYRMAAPWLLGGVLIIKSEGEILFGIICMTILVVWASRGPGKFIATLRQYSGAIAVVLTCASLRGVYLSWVDTKDSTYGPFDQRHFAQAYTRLWTVPATCAHYLLNRADWTIFWPVAFLAVLLVIWKGGIRERALSMGLLAALACYTGIFYFTNWEFHLHIDQAFNRLLVQISPAAAILTVIGYQYLAGQPIPEPSGNRDSSADR